MYGTWPSNLDVRLVVNEALPPSSPNPRRILMARRLAARRTIGGLARRRLRQQLLLARRYFLHGPISSLSWAWPLALTAEGVVPPALSLGFPLLDGVVVSVGRTLHSSCRRAEKARWAREAVVLN